MENKRYTCIRLQNNDKVVCDSGITRKFEKKKPERGPTNFKKFRYLTSSRVKFFMTLRQKMAI